MYDAPLVLPMIYRWLERDTTAELKISGRRSGRSARGHVAVTVMEVCTSVYLNGKININVDLVPGADMAVAV